MTLGWLGQEVGCTLNPGVNLKEIREDGVELPETMVVRMRNGGLLELSSFLLRPITCQAVEHDHKSQDDINYDSDSTNSISEDCESEDEELDDRV